MGLNVQVSGLKVQGLGFKDSGTRIWHQKIGKRENDIIPRQVVQEDKIMEAAM